MSVEVDHWRPCSSCKKPISFSQIYWTCNVSTCNRKRTGLLFCSISCWDAHVPIMRHRESWAEEQRSPTREAWAREQQTAAPVAKGSAANRAAPAKPSAPTLSRTQSKTQSGANSPDEILIVASKLKAYVKARSGMNTSDAVMSTLSARVRALCDGAIREARRAERQTIMGRDFPKLRR